ncbi:MAG: metabolite traffic protein EboE [Planctomycetota bacterium]|nr:metabolite traffic protein EboE [Planctomycetota bacterium]
MSVLRIGYCTNVHAGTDLAQTKANLQRHARAVKRRFSPDVPMGVGLWLAAPAAAQLLDGGELSQVCDWLAEIGLTPFTFNGFPYGDFHSDVVKHDVYLPTWWDQERFDYTLNLIQIQHALLPAEMEGSISTLPIAWGKPAASGSQLDMAAAKLREVADRLWQLEQETGRLIHLCLEPEPGCVLQVSDDVVRLFEDHLLPGGDEDRIRRHLRVCHDVCHAAVMFEEQADVLRAYKSAGIAVGKVQVSSAVVVPFERIAPSDRSAAVEQLSGFAEDRYLHQTCTRSSGGQPRFWEDLPTALAAVEDPAVLTDEWRIHFHVPVYLDRFGFLETSQSQVADCLQAAAAMPDLTHYEVETYAWSVLPQSLQKDELAEGIAEEMEWFRTTIGSF